MGDSGTFGSRAMMNKIGKAQQAKKSPVSYAFKGQRNPINAKYTAKNVKSRISNLANKLFFN